MVFLRKTRVGQKIYLQIGDYYDDFLGIRRLKLLKSFGPDRAESRADAAAYLANVQLMQQIRREYPFPTRETFFTTAHILAYGIIAAYLGVSTLDWVYYHY